MAWQDRSYNQTGGGGGGFGGGAMSLLSFSLPFGTWLGVRVRLHIWMLLSIFLLTMSYLDIRQPGMLIAHIVMLLAAVMLHEFGHRFVARRMGGSHEEFMLWPAGGTIPANPPPYPLATFLTHGAGIATNLLLAVLAGGAIYLLTGAVDWSSLNPLRFLGALAPLSSDLALRLLGLFIIINIGVAFVAILPYYWFDGAYLLQSILWPWTGLRQAINITCIVGMVLAVPLFLLSLAGGSIWGMLFWGLLFYTAYQRRKQLQYEDVEYDLTAAYSVPGAQPRRSPVRRAKFQRWLMDRRVQKQANLQKQVDEILEKVARSGMHSLTSSEKKLLERASRELREQESPRHP